MSKKAGLSIYEKLLLAAYKLEQKGRSPFSAEDLVVSAWRIFPDAFGLSGYHGKDGRLSYPDSNRVYAEIMGTKPIRKNGFLRKVGIKLYKLTESGRIRANEIFEISSIKDGENGRLDRDNQEAKAGLARDIQMELTRLFKSKACIKYKNNRVEDITFHDASVFWRISPMSSAIEFKDRISNFKKIIETANKAVQNKAVSFKHGGVTHDSDDLKTLIGVHEVLKSKFNDDIRVILTRTDERK